MFIELTNLDAEKHRMLRYSSNQPYDFAREMVMIPLVASEVARVAREMPIVFPKGEGVPQALTGVTPGENLHVKDSGHWQGRYIPAHIRRYPFMLGEVPTTEAQRAEKGRQYMLQFDAAARHFERPDGHALLDESGKPTNVLKKVQQVLMALEQDQQRTLGLVKQLEQAGLLVERNLTVSEGGNKQVISGFRLVDEQALSKLSAEMLSELHNSGALSLAYAHLLSLTNVHDGLIASALSGNSKAHDIDELFNEGDDDLTFDFDS